jgi:hypothetical protein
MRANRILILITAAALCCLFAGGAGAWSPKHLFSRQIEGSGDVETRDFDVGDFDTIELNGAFDVEVTVGRSTSVAVTLDDNLFEYLEVEVEGGSLILDFDDPVDPTESTVTINVPELEAFVINGAGDVDIRGFDGGAFSYRLRGAGDTELSGKVDELEIQLSGAGDIDASDLVAQDAEVRVSGAGNAKVHVENRIDARVSGVGNIVCYGNPKEERSRVSGIGDIDFR